MKTGDPKQVAVLGAVALVVVGVAVMRAVPKPAVVVALKTESKSQPQDLSTTAASLPTMLLHDAFSNSKLAKKKDFVEQAPSSVPTTKMPPLPLAGSGWESSTAPLSVKPELPIPEEPSKNTRQQEGEEPQPDVQKVSVQLEATMHVRRPLALISLNGAEAKTFGVGSTVGDKLKVVGITEDSVTLRVGETLQKVRVGEKVQF